MPGPETKGKLREPGVPSMIEVVEILESDASFAALPLDDRLCVVVDYAYREAENAHVARLLRNAHLRLPQAGVANIDYDGRPPGRTPVTELATCHLVASATDVIIEGLTGTGPPCLCAGEAGLQARAQNPLGAHARHAGVPVGEAVCRMVREEGAEQVCGLQGARRGRVPRRQAYHGPDAPPTRAHREALRRLVDDILLAVPHRRMALRMGGGAHAESVI